MNFGSLKVLRFNRLVPYPEALILQQHLVSKKLMNRLNEPDYLIVLEHEPCVTLGRRCHSESDSIKSSYPIFKSPRGGKVTFHGPGQLTCYPIVDLKRQPELSLEFYVQNLAKVMKETLSKAYNLNDSYYDNDPIRVGLWLPSNKKIGFIGIQAQKWITSHGFSINIKRESLKGFHDIDPCGLSNQNMTVTCVEDNIENNTVTKDVLVLSDLIIDSFISTYRYSLTK